MEGTNQRFAPLLERNGLREVRKREFWLHVPELEGAFLREWCWDALSSCFSSLYGTERDYDALLLLPAGYRLARSLNIELPRSCSIDYGENWAQEARPDPVALILSAADDDPDFLLNLADYLIHSGLMADERTTELEDILVGSESAWQVARDKRSLVLGVSPELDQLYLDAVSDEDSAAAYLSKAWDAAWRRDRPSAVEAYDGSVKAVESILAPIVIPDNTEPTLGKIIAALNDKPTKWDTRFRGAETVQALKGLLKELWKTDSRHAEMPENSIAQAKDAVTIAVAVLALVRRDFLTRVDES